jgi:hypothetical protein
MITELLPIHPGFKDIYLSKIDQGKKLLKQSNITIISLVRSIDISLIKNIPLIINFFKNYAYNLNHIFYENDSIDKTKLILNKYKKIYPNNIHLISKNFDREQFGSIKNVNRIKALAEYRNEAKEYAKTIDSDFIVVLDMDFDDINLDGLLNSFGWLAAEQSVSAVAGNSFYLRSGLYKDNPERYNIFNYDSWAFRHNWWTDFHVSPPAPSNTLDSMAWFGFWIPPTGSHPITVNSAFGGCGIYRKDIYFRGLYDHMDCEHVCFHYSLAMNKDINFRLVLNPSQQMLFESIDV